MANSTQAASNAGARTNTPRSASPSHLDALAAARVEIAELRARLTQALNDVADVADTMNWQRREIGKLRAALALSQEGQS